MTTSSLPFSTVLVANRGEIAVRLIEATKSLGLTAIAVFVAPDSSSPHIRLADQALSLGSSPAQYTNIPALLTAARTANADAVLPGYGFISENPEAAEAFERAGVRWIGPRSETIRLFGLKHTARDVAKAAKVPTIPGSPLIKSQSEAIHWASKVGFPILLKASAGGGGMGQAIVRDKHDLKRSYESVVSQSEELFSSKEIYIERYIERARHIEVQVFGDGKGVCLALGDRDCSVQRRRQKVIEEGNAPNLTDSLRSQLRKAAADMCAAHNYRSAGTVEFILDDESKEWFFLEVNTRLQVEHGVTEMVSGIDIVQWMLLLAGGIDVLEDGAVQWEERGTAIEARLYAENPVKGYIPSPGTLSEMIWPDENPDPAKQVKVRVDSWAERGSTIPPYYDSMLGKVLAWGKTRPLAIMALKRALESTIAMGVVTNKELLLQTLRRPEFLTGTYTTSLLDRFPPQTKSVEVVMPGLQSSLQDYPGRVGYWNIGVSPSGPMDCYAMGVANALVGNSIHATAIEITVSGPTLVFHCDAVIAVTGGNFLGEIDDGKPLPFWTPFKVKAGSVVSIGTSVGSEAYRDDGGSGGKIAYLAVRGGFEAPKYLGSSATFPTGKFGGLTGSFLSLGDFLPIGKSSSIDLDEAEENGLRFRWPLNKQLRSHFIPQYDNPEWTIAALSGPHASPEFLNETSINDIWSSTYTVHHATNRLGARLIGPTPKWTRADGGSAGLHPSNLHDYTYAPGAVNFSGNTPIVLMLDGPSLGGFICPITVASADLWKVAQASPGEKLRFKQVDFSQARDAFVKMGAVWEAICTNDTDALDTIACTWNPSWVNDGETRNEPAVLASLDPENGDKAEIKVVYRMSGDEHVLVEYGEIELDISYRLRVHMTMEELKGRSYIKELCPGVRSVLIRYDRLKINVQDLVNTLKELEDGVLGSVEGVAVPSRVINLPLAFGDKWTLEAQNRYLRSVRPNAPYMPSNLEFIRRINGLDSIDNVRDIMTSAEYMVLGLGDVYLGAPCAVPVDPRHRIVTSKYNPARTFTPEGAVGIGGAYMCIYGMDSPGGYQLAGRTLPIWDNYGAIPERQRGAPRHIPWLLRFFDRVRFYAVSDDELQELRELYKKGAYTIPISEETFSYKEYVQFCEKHNKEILAFESKRRAAYDAERARWEADGEGENNAAARHATSSSAENGNHLQRQQVPVIETPPFSINVTAGLSATVWAVHVENGQSVTKGQSLVSLETMKVEVQVEAPADGIIEQMSALKGEPVTADTNLCLIISSREEVLGNLQIDQLRDLFKLEVVGPKDIVDSALSNIPKFPAVFELVMPKEECTSQIQRLQNRKRQREHLPLFGVPFVVADDIDVKGHTTHLGFSDVAYTAKASAFVVDALQNAGAILIGKTKIDQLNVGYTGVEMEGAVPENPMYPGLIVGGNGPAAIAVRRQLASFAIVVDRHGKSTISPALCGISGLKTTEGLLPISQKIGTNVDCISIYGNSTEDVSRVLDICLRARQEAETVARPLPSVGVDFSEVSRHGVKLGICLREDVALSSRHRSENGLANILNRLSFTNKNETSCINQYYRAVDIFSRQGYQLQPVDISAFISAAETCDNTPLNYMKLTALQEVARKSHKKMLSSISERLLSAEQITASEFAKALTGLDNCRRLAESDVWTNVDALVLPLNFTILRRQEVNGNIRRATRALSWFPQLVTCMDLCALTLHLSPGKGENQPYGVLVVAPAFKEQLLLKIGFR